jgi:hypothetical protein
MRGEIRITTIVIPAFASAAAWGRSLRLSPKPFPRRPCPLLFSNSPVGLLHTLVLLFRDGIPGNRFRLYPIHDLRPRQPRLPHQFQRRIGREAVIGQPVLQIPRQRLHANHLHPPPQVFDRLFVGSWLPVCQTVDDVARIQVRPVLKLEQ